MTKEQLKDFITNRNIDELYNYMENIKKDDSYNEIIEQLREIIRDDKRYLLYVCFLPEDKQNEFDEEVIRFLKELKDKEKTKELLCVSNPRESLEYLSEMITRAEQKKLIEEDYKVIIEEALFQNIISLIKEDKNFSKYLIANYPEIFSDVLEVVSLTELQLDNNDITQIINNQKENLRIIDYLTKEQVSENITAIKEAIKTKKYKITSFSSENIRNNVELIKYSITVMPQTIDVIPEEMLGEISEEDIINALKNGYIFYNETRDYIKNNPKYVSIGMDYVEDKSKYYNINEFVSHVNEAGLTKENFEKAMNLGYEYTEQYRGETPEYIKNNSKYLIPLLKSSFKNRGINNSYHYLYNHIVKNLPEEKFTLELLVALLEDDRTIYSLPEFVYKRPDAQKEIIKSNFYNINVIPSKYITQDLANFAYDEAIKYLKDNQKNIDDEVISIYIPCKTTKMAIRLLKEPYLFSLVKASPTILDNDEFDLELRNKFKTSIPVGMKPSEFINKLYFKEIEISDDEDIDSYMVEIISKYQKEISEKKAKIISSNKELIDLFIKNTDFNNTNLISFINYIEDEKLREEIIFKVINETNYNYKANTPKAMCEYKYVLQATKKDKFTAIKYLDFKKLTDDELKEIIPILFEKNQWEIISIRVKEESRILNYLNVTQLEMIKQYSKINSPKLREKYQNYVKENADKLKIDNIKIIGDLLLKISMSNSSEIKNFETEIADSLLQLDNPIEKFEKIEDIFLKNNLPIVGKIYKVFEITHPDFQGFNFNSKISPVLSAKSNRTKEIVIFADLMKSFLGSNNRSLKSYLDNLEEGNKLIISLSKKERKYEELSKEEKEILQDYVYHLNTLYNNTKKGLKEDKKILTGDIMTDVKKLTKLFSQTGEIDYNLPDRIVRMYCGFIGINTVAEAKQYIQQKVEEANKRNRKNSRNYKLEDGDLVKGIGRIDFLSKILQNGSLSKEYLGASAGSDATPLDTDVSMVRKNPSLASLEAKEYGPIFFVLKNRDNRFQITRNSPQIQREEDKNKIDLSKLELFYTGVLGTGHYGIRTGFASTEIDYIMVYGAYDKRIGLEIAKNGFYIPVVTEEGNVLFTEEDYENIRSTMQGLSYYGTEEYKLSNNLYSNDSNELAIQLLENASEVKEKKDAINEVIRQVLEKHNLKLKETIDGNLENGTVELIDTGSTGRGTNTPGDGDFDYIMRLDNQIILNSEEMNQIKKELLEKFSCENKVLTHNGDFRLKGVKINGLKDPVDIDITFTEKTDKINYSTDMCVRDRLNSIKKQYPSKYNQVIANILEAKKVLKEYECYKPNRGAIPQGGLGGVGIENWILQNGGSFQDAARNFLEQSENKSLEEYKNTHFIYDFGENHLAARINQYPHDNFIYNMNESGYNKMKIALKEYLKKIELQDNNTYKNNNSMSI